MTVPERLPTTQTRIIARSIEADPPKPPRRGISLTLRPLGKHPAGIPLVWSAGLVTGIGLAPLLLERIHLDVFGQAAALARMVAPAWPAGGAPSLWPAAFATLAWFTGAVVVVLAVIGVGLPDLAVLGLAGVLVVTTGRAAWSTLDVVNAQAWAVLPACVVVIVAFLLAARSALAWRKSGTDVASAGPIPATLFAWFLTLLLIVAGTAGANAAMKQAAQTASSSTSLPQTGVAGMEAARQADAPAFAALRGHWAAQIASARSLDDAGATAYLQQQQAWAGKFPVVLVRGDDFRSTALDASYWLTFAKQPFGSQTEVQSWCSSQGLGQNDCMPRLLPAG